MMDLGLEPTRSADCKPHGLCPEPLHETHDTILERAAAGEYNQPEIDIGVMSHQSEAEKYVLSITPHREAIFDLYR
jgi:hypothetical protein